MLKSGITCQAQGAVQNPEELAEEGQNPDAHHDLRDHNGDIERKLREWLQSEVIALKRKGSHRTNDRRDDRGDEGNRECVPRGFDDFLVL